MAGKPWTEEEKKYIRENYVAMSCREMAEKIGRTTKAVQHYYNLNGLERPEPKKGDKIYRWELLTDKYLVSMYGQQKGMVLARCVCGVEREVLLAKIVSGKSQSCGCLRDEKARERMIAMAQNGLNSHPSHELSHHPVYRLYYSILDRCYHKGRVGYKNYGGRGIKMCEQWKGSFLTFYEWAMSSGWKQGLTIERDNVNGDYCPENCSWKTKKQQANNRRNNHILTAFGETKNLQQWVDDPRCPVDYNTVRFRLKYGWSPEDAITKISIRKNN